MLFFNLKLPIFPQNCDSNDFDILDLFFAFYKHQLLQTKLFFLEKEEKWQTNTLS